MKAKSWQPLTDRIIKNAGVYTTKDFKPTHSDVADILDIDCNAIIAHHEHQMLVFVGGRLESCGPVFMGSGKIGKGPRGSTTTISTRHQ